MLSKSPLTLLSHAGFPLGCSTTINRGLKYPATRNISGHKVSPVLLPWIAAATLVRWHGGPPQITSGLANALHPNVNTSSHRGTLGQCLLRTRRRNSSFSTCHLHSRPALSKPRSKPPIPAKREPKLSFRGTSSVSPNDCALSIFGRLSNRPSRVGGVNGLNGRNDIFLLQIDRVELKHNPAGQRRRV